MRFSEKVLPKYTWTNIGHLRPAYIWDYLYWFTLSYI